MELTQTYKHKPTVTSAGTIFQKAVMTFVNRHAGVFKALTRGGTPYGDNWLSASGKTTESGTTSGMPEKQIDRLQQQIDELIQTIASLSDQVNAHKVSMPTDPKPFSETDAIGINRFRALQAEC